MRRARERRTATLVELEDLKVYFPIKSGIVLDRHVGDIKAVDGVTLDDPPRRDARPRRRVGLREVDGRPRDPPALQADRAARSSSTAQDITHARRERPAPAAPADADGLPGPVRVAEPAPLRRPHRRRAAAHPRPGEPARASAPRVRELLGIVGLPADAASRYPHEFSGGQRQRIGIARALALNPDFVVADEPVSALDVSIQAQIINLLENLQDEFDLTYLFIAHDLAVVRHISDRIAVMYLGEIVEISPADELYDNPLHPYTISLLSAVPIPDPEVEQQRETILLAGDLPSPANPPPACRFHTRCPYVQETRCKTDVPELRKLADGHVVACHWAEEIKAGRIQPHEVAAGLRSGHSGASSRRPPPV